LKWVTKSSDKLARFLQNELSSYSGKGVRRLLSQNQCRVNGKIERFASRTIERGDLVELSLSLQPRNQQFEIIFENEILKIINKPAGFVSSPQNTLRTFGPNLFLVHRLDVGTTGLLVLAKSPSMREQMMALFQERKIRKSYLAIVDGSVQKTSWTQESFFVKKGAYHGQTLWASNPYQGLHAITRFQRLAVGEQASLLLAEPLTGRTHQIRVHAAEMGHPILVDPQYARRYRSSIPCSRPHLHAYGLQFTVGDEMLELKAPLPQDMKEVLIKASLEMGLPSQPFLDEGHH